jgi:hypothetical protein
MALLSADYARLTSDASPASADEAFWLSIAQDDVGSTAAQSALERAIAAGFQTSPVLQDPQSTDSLGVTLLKAMTLFDRGADGNLNDLSKALTILRTFGQDDVARRAALQLLIRQAGS